MPLLTHRHLLLSSLIGLAGCIWVSDAEHRARLGPLDADGDGYGSLEVGGTDCDDSDPEVHPDAPERCATPGDDNCDGVANGEDAADRTTFHRDGDDDGWGGEDAVQACTAPDGYVERDGDCDDSDGSVYPGAPETCPGLGEPDRDCDPTPSPCVASVEDLPTVLTASGAGTFLVEDGSLLEITPGGLFLWAPGSLSEGLTGRASADDVGPDGAVGSPVAFSGAWLAMRRGEDPGQVWWRDLGGSAQTGIVEPRRGRPTAFGTGLAWTGPGELAILDAINAERTDLVRVDVAAGQDERDIRSIVGGAERLIAGPDGQLVATQPAGGLMWLGPDRASDFAVTGEGLGTYAVTLADVDGDAAPDLLASTAEALHVWRGPIDADLDLTDAWWSLPLGGPAQTVTVADLGQDGRPDLIVSVRGEGGGEVRVYRDAATRPATPWATIGPGGPALGASLGVTTVRLDGTPTQAILLGDAVAGRILALPWP